MGRDWDGRVVYVIVVKKDEKEDIGEMFGMVVGRVFMVGRMWEDWEMGEV